MNPKSELETHEKLILRGIDLELSEAMKSLFEAKADRLLRHEPRIDRIRIDLACENHGGHRQFVAKGTIEIAGPDMFASATSDDAYKSVDLLVNKLDREIRKRMAELIDRRSRDDIRDHRPA